MKKTLLFLFAAFFAMAMNAQVILDEGFENGIPDDWSQIDNDGDGYGWYSADQTGTTDYVHTGSNCAMTTSYSGEELDSDNWLITSQIDLPAGSACILYYAVASMDATWPENLMVKLSTSGNDDVDQFTVTLQELEPITSTTDDYDVREIDLSDYAGQSVYIAFIDQTSGGYYLFLDDVKVINPTSDPEIELSSLNVPSAVFAGESFNIAGVVTNLSENVLTSFKVQYSVDGNNSSNITVSDINVAYGETYSFTHTEPVNPSATGMMTISVVVSEPNGFADDISNNTINTTVNVCGAISTLPVEQGFENGMECWSVVVSADDNTNSIGVTTDASAIRTGNAAFRFNSFSRVTSDDYTAYLISPELELPGAATLSFWYNNTIDGQYGDEEAILMVSSTDNDIASFSELGESFSTSTSEFAEYTAIIPASAKFIAIKYLSNYIGYMGIDDITLSEAPTTPEIKLNALTVPDIVAPDEQFSISGVVMNNGGVAINSFTVQYDIDGNNSSVPLNGLDIAAGESYTFTLPTPVSLSSEGSHNLTVTVSNPNATADNESDNTLYAVITVCNGVSTFPYIEMFAEGSACWQNVDNDGDGKKWEWMEINDTLGLMVSYSYDNSSYSPISADNWLISPAMQLPSNSSIMASWFDFNMNLTYSDSYSIYVATSNNISDFLTSEPLAEYTPDTTLTQRTQSLTSYAGQTVYFAFRHNDYDNLGLAMTAFSVNVEEAQLYTITVVSDNETMGTAAASNGNTYADGASCTITATANPGYHFVRWNEDITSNPYTFTVTGDATYTAYFEENSGTEVYYTITVVSDNTDMGTVNGGGQVLEHGSVQISATALTGYHFTHWNDNNTENPRTLTDVTADATYTAYFEENSGAEVYYTITVVSDNTDMGTVSGGGQVLEHGSVQISATALTGYHFTHWNDNNTDNPRTLTNVTANATYTAYFEADAPQQGIDDVTSANVKLYPNPTSCNLFVEVEGLQKVEVIDAVGRIVLSQDNGTVNMGKLANGVYSVRITANGNIAVKKVVKR